MSGAGAALPPVEELLESAVVVRLPMRTRFRGITAREVMLLRGPAGWGEFAPFIEYDDAESSAWLASGVEAAYLGPPVAVRDRVEVNATVPAVPAGRVAEILARYPGVRTAKVKVAEAGQSLAEDVERVAAAADVVERVRVDANGNWSVAQAITAIGAMGPGQGVDLEYVEQPCATVDELARVRRAVTVPIAADESIRKADDPFRVVAAAAADVAVLKVAPLGGMRRVLELAETIGLPVVVSSALDSAVGIAAGVAAAAALPTDLACGLGTGTLFVDDVAPSFVPESGAVLPRWFAAESIDAAALAADPRLHAEPAREKWWRERLERTHAVLAAGGGGVGARIGHT